MTMKIRGFLLFGFAFASVLSCSEVVTSTRSASSKTIQPATTTDTPSKVLKELRTQVVDHDLKKRAIEIYQPKTSGNSEIENAFENENKRGSRFRFNGMRGKKDVGNDYFESYSGAGVEKPDNPVFKKSEEVVYEGKRIPLGFYGLKGKKLEDLDSKKVKSDSSDFDSPTTIQRYLINSGLTDDINASDMDYFEDVLTRPDKEEWDNNVFNEKSPKSFQGMKGKSSLYELKQALGLTDMRSKKSAGIWSRYFGYKRVPQSSFFGVKGKKMKSRFFGMRGKKSDEGFNEPSSYQFQDSGLFDKITEEESPRNRFRRQVWPSNSKKKNHFYGLRGRRSADEKLARIQDFYSQE